MLMHSTMAAVRQCYIMAAPGLRSKSPASLKIALAMATAPSEVMRQRAITAILGDKTKEQRILSVTAKIKHIMSVFYNGICDLTTKQGLEKQLQVSIVFSSISKLIHALSLCVCSLKFQDSSSFTVLDFLSLSPSGKHSMCTLHLSRFYSHSKSASTNIATFHSPNAHLQDVLKCQMLNSTKKHFTMFLLTCNITEKAEIALISVGLLDLNTLFLSSGSSRAINAATASSELATVH